MKVYDQHCPLASALDLVGDRWTLLIVRELLFLGPRRFNDLSRGLPGLAPNLLSSRLRMLEDGGVIEREVAPPPAKARMYRLTEEGTRLREPVVGLMRWGVRHMVPLGEHDSVRPEMVPIGLQASFVPELALGVDARYELIFEDFTVHAHVVAGELALEERSSTSPDLRIRMPLRVFVGFVNAEVDATEAVVSGQIQVEGEPAEIDRFLRLFGGLVPLAT